jgi:putative membrane protein
MMWWHLGSLGWGMMALGIICMLVFWGAIIALIIWGVRRLSRHEINKMNTAAPLDIVKERYAKGEITKEQFEQMKKDLL